MGRTLFWYIFKDLLKIFFMTSGALGGIMSFGGLLRPLTQQGLDGAQVSKMLTYFTLPMMAYSLPVAALFSATVVYGRLSADNELTACRAGGISHLNVAMPGFVLGLVVALLSLLMLCFVVPIYTLKVEKVIYSNLAKLIANRIERTHEVKFGDFNVFAQKAYLPGPDPARPNVQRVVLEGVSIATYTRTDKADSRYKVPREFLLASSATVEIHEQENDQVELMIGLEGGIKFPRELAGGQQLGVESTQFGPIPIQSPIKEDTKFMKLQDMRELYLNPEKSRRIQGMLSTYIRRDQVIAYMSKVKDHLNEVGTRRVEFDDPDGKVIITLSNDAPGALEEGKWFEDLTVRTDTPTGERKPGKITFQRLGDQPTTQYARGLRLSAKPEIDEKTKKTIMHVTIELLDRFPPPSSASPTPGGGKPVSGNYTHVASVEMPPEIARIANREASYYRVTNGVPKGDRDKLARELTVLYNGIWAESMGRASFATSCFILVALGSALGMLFRSGNFLTAFAVSFLPALLCITLIVAGQQTCHAVPDSADKANPLNLGIALIWSGNGINLILATVMLWKLQRQ